MDLKDEQGSFLEQILPQKRVREGEKGRPWQSDRVRPKTQDGHPLRKVERLFAWLQNYRRVATRWDYSAKNYEAFVQMACLTILMERYL